MELVLLLTSRANNIQLNSFVTFVSICRSSCCRRCTLSQLKLALVLLVASALPHNTSM
jgi:hypothetical protein